jgi:hypothetical protein
MPASVTRPEETALYLADRCAELEAENAKLREAARWRKWPEEIPKKHGLYLTVDCADGLKNLWFDGGWPWPNVTHWRPIGNLPGGE